MGVLLRKRKPDFGLSPDDSSLLPFLYLLLLVGDVTADVTGFCGKSPRWIEMLASCPLAQSLRTCTTSLCDIPRTEMLLISIRMSPSWRFLHRGLSKIFFTFCPNALSAMVKPKPIPPFVMGMVMWSLRSPLMLCFNVAGSTNRSPKRSALPGRTTPVGCR